MYIQYTVSEQLLLRNNLIYGAIDFVKSLKGLRHVLSPKTA